jgi:ribonuclease HI
MNLREAAEKALRVLSQVESNEYCELDSAIKALRTALAEAEEPVAWFESPYGEVRINPHYKFQFPSSLLSWQIPLYTRPPRREPLTEEEVRRLYREAWTPEREADEVLAFARAIERAHGIGGDAL